MECPNCNKIYDDDFKFCPYCGAEKPAPKICPNCELEPSIEFSFCPECGTELIEKAEFERAKEYIREGIEYFESVDYEKSIRNFNKALEIVVPKGCIGEINSILNTIANDMLNFDEFGILEESLNCYEEFLKLEPSNVIYLFGKANCLFGLKRYEKSIECYNKSIEIKPSNSTFWNQKAICLFHLKKYEESIECNNIALKLSDIPYYYYNQSECYFELKKYEEAYRCYDKITEFYTYTSVETWVKKGTCLFELGKYEEALKCYDEGIEKQKGRIYGGDTSILWTNKGKCYEELGRDEEAEECYEKAKSLKD